jgi:hypothetical protein
MTGFVPIAAGILEPVITKKLPHKNLKRAQWDMGHPRFELMELNSNTKFGCPVLTLSIAWGVAALAAKSRDGRHHEKLSHKKSETSSKPSRQFCGDPVTY